jgi:hypothetical protein
MGLWLIWCLCEIGLPLNAGTAYISSDRNKKEKPNRARARDGKPRVFIKGRNPVTQQDAGKQGEDSQLLPSRSNYDSKRLED